MRHDDYCAVPASNHGHIGRVGLGTMERRLARHSKLLASERLSCSRHGDIMKPKDPIKHKDRQETLPPAFLCPVDTEDCFELAYEADEFGVRQPDHSTDG
jgi:hypothetical protein